MSEARLSRRKLLTSVLDTLRPDIRPDPEIGRKTLSRREFLHMSVLAASAIGLTGCKSNHPDTLLPTTPWPTVVLTTPTTVPKATMTATPLATVAPTAAAAIPLPTSEQQPPVQDQEPVEKKDQPTVGFTALHIQLLSGYIRNHSGPAKLAEIESTARTNWSSGHVPEEITSEQEAIAHYLTTEFANSDQLQRLQTLLVEKYNAVYGWNSRWDKFHFFVKDFLQYSMVINYLCLNTNLSQRLRALGELDLAGGYEYTPPKAEFCYSPCVVLTENAWRSAQSHYITQLNLGLVAGIMATEYGEEANIFQHLKDNSNHRDVTNAHIGLQALAYSIPGANCSYFPPLLPEGYKGVVIDRTEINEDHKTETIEQAELVTAYMLTPLIMAMRCFGKTNVQEGQMEELALYNNHEMRQPRVAGVIGQFNTNPNWSKWFTGSFEVFETFCNEYPEWSYIMDLNLLQN